MTDTNTNHQDDTSLQRARTALAQLAARPPKPSKAAQIRQLLPEIEAAQAAGASRKEIVEALRNSGLDVSMKTFSTALARARRKRTQRAHNPQQQSQTKQEDPPQQRIRRGLQMPDPPKKLALW